MEANDNLNTFIRVLFMSSHLCTLKDDGNAQLYLLNTYKLFTGQYSLVEPDGSVRTVNYVADWETGFHADVRNSKDNQH